MATHSEKEAYSLHGLAKANNVEGMIKLVGSHENLNAKDKLKRTPLHLACYFGSIDAARFLIESGANVNALASDDVRPLAFAIMKNHIEIVKILLTNGALSGINATFQKNRITCLHLAAKNNNKEIVQLLLESGSNPNIRSREQRLAIDETTNEEIKTLITEYTKKWNDEKKLKVQMRRKKRREGMTSKDSDDKETDSLKRQPSVDSIETIDPSKQDTNDQSSIKSPPSKKLDLKKLAFVLNEDD